MRKYLSDGNFRNCRFTDRTVTELEKCVSLSQVLETLRTYKKPVSLIQRLYIQNSIEKSTTPRKILT